MSTPTPSPEPSLFGISSDRRCPGCGQARPPGAAPPSTGSCPSCNLVFDSWDSQAPAPQAEPWSPVLESPEFKARYADVTKLTAGGMGAVFTGIDRELDRQVALKISLAPSPESLKRFLREGQLLARVSHPNVVKIYSVESYAGSPVLAFELLTGRTLKSEVVARGKFEPARAIELIDRVLAGLEAIHQIGIVHRDLKGDNILLLEDDEPRIIDFGLARDTEDETSITRAGVVLGTPAYMAPEQATGGVIGPACDIYSAGIILYELLVGRLPFQADSPVELLRSQITRIPPLASSVNPALSPALDRVLARALEKDPADRFPGAVAMREALRDVEWKQESAATRALEAPALRRITTRQPPARRTGLSASAETALPASAAVSWPRRLLAALAFASLLFLAHRFSTGEEMLGFQLAIGQRSLVVRLPQALDVTMSLIPESGGVPILPRQGPGMRRFEGLSPATTYRLERGTWRGPMLLTRVETRASLEERITFEIATSPDGAAEIRLHRGDGVGDDVVLGVRLGDRELISPASARDRFVIPVQQIDRLSSLTLHLPDVTEVIGAPVELHDLEGLTRNLDFHAQQLERQLLELQNACYVHDAAIPAPARFDFRPAPAGSDTSLDGLRVLGPSIAAWIGARSIGFEKRWKLASAVLPLAAAETFAREKGLPPLGLLAWLHSLVQIEYQPRCVEHARRFELPFDDGQRGKRFLAGGTRSNEAKEAILIANAGEVTQEELRLQTRPAAGWITFLFCMDLEWHEPRDRRAGPTKEQIDRGSSPPAILFPAAGLAFELPLITSPTAPSTLVWEGLSRQLNVRLRFQAPKDPALLRDMVMRPVLKPVSGRVGPLYVRQVYQMETVSAPE